MGRLRILIALTAAAASLLSLVSPAFAQGGGNTDPGNGSRREMQRPRQSQQARQRWREMLPEDRQRIRRNAERWLQLDPEERRELRDRDGVRRLRMRRDSEEALERSGLQLEAERREAWFRQYLQERRRIERTLRQELEEKRQRELGPVVERLNKEFSGGQGTGTPNVRGEGTPQK